MNTSNNKVIRYKQSNRLVVGISGASGSILGIEILKAMRDFPGWETHLVISKGAERTIVQETPYSVMEVINMATQVHAIEDIGASIASGTFKTEGMVIAPCSMKTLAGIACGYSDNLLLRAADVSIKEKRNLVLLTRESPLSTIHLKNMLFMAQQGATILPPMLTYYNKPSSIEDLNRHIIGKALSIFNIDIKGFKRWGEQACMN